MQQAKFDVIRRNMAYCSVMPKSSDERQCSICTSTTHHSSGLHPFITFILFCSVVHRECLLFILMDGQNRRLVPASITVIWGGPHCDELLVEHVLVAFLDQLVCASDEPQRVYVVELPGEYCQLRSVEEMRVADLPCHAPTKEPAGTTGTDSPVIDVVRI
jgi:hypothetical protein